MRLHTEPLNSKKSKRILLSARTVLAILDFTMFNV